ncbi:MAG: DUF1565 domain-containing protein [bacterium]|nr:DUF1565 domain-containing protein [bacterium]
MKLPALVAALVLSSPVVANDWYVDALNGSDSNSGTSPTDAWRTITEAVAQLGPAPPAPGVRDNVHVFPGVYDPAHGEVFPIDLRDGLWLIGDRGQEETILDAGGAIALRFQPQGPLPSVDPGAQGVTIRNASRGISMTSTASHSGILRGIFRDVRIEGCANGIWVRATTMFTLNNNLDLDRVDIVDSTQSGLTAEGYGFVADVHVTMDDCRVEGSGGDGIRLFTDFDSNSSVFMHRSAVLHNDVGVNAWGSNSGNSPVFLRLIDSVIAHNDVGISSNWLTTLERSTVADNARAGVQFHEGGHGPLRDSILFGNGDDVQLLGIDTATITRCNVGDGDGQGMNGNISVDPLFRDPAQDDYRLGFGTGCVDAIPGASGPDLTGFERGNDGNLDLVGAGDMGAFELRTLAAPETAGIGKKLHIDIHAEPGDFTVLWLARSLQLPVPDPTPFGDRWLPAPFLELVATRKVLTSNPLRYTVYVPDLPILIGQPFSFQALSRSSAAPAGAAWTDAVTVTLTP